MLHYFVKKSCETAENLTHLMINTAIPALSTLEKRLLIKKYERKLSQLRRDTLFAEKEHIEAYECIHYLHKDEDELIKKLSMLKQ